MTVCGSISEPPFNHPSTTLERWLKQEKRREEKRLKGLSKGSCSLETQTYPERAQPRCDNPTIGLGI